MNKKITDQEQARLNKLLELQKNKSNPYEITSVKRTHDSKTFKECFQKFSKAKLHSFKTNITLSGRVVGIRRTFILVQDFYGKTQIYLNKNKHKKLFEYFNNYLDLGDIISVSGKPMKTNTGELSLDIYKLKIISKSLKTPPEKFHGLNDEEERARKRYLDLIYNPSSMQAFVMRSKVISLMRTYLDKLGYLEVETPILQPTLGGANARPFITHHNTLKRDYFLRVASEIPLKQLIVGGFEKVYEIGRIFRNEGMDATHNPEFTSIELYLAYGNMDSILNLTESLIKYIAKQLKKTKITLNGSTIDLSKKFHKINMVDLIKRETGINFYEVKSAKEAMALAKKHNIKYEKHQQTYGHIVNLFFEHFCEDKLIEPTFVTGHPVDVSPLSKINYKDPRFTERFELFIFKKEFANAYSELNDPIDQKQRFENQILEKKQGNNEAVDIDYAFLEALEYALPPTGGLGIGIDRLAMLFAEKTSIRDVLLFPHMRDTK